MVFLFDPFIILELFKGIFVIFAIFGEMKLFYYP